MGSSSRRKEDIAAVGSKTGRSNDIHPRAARVAG
jgi:hypothetical protein